VQKSNSKSGEIMPQRVLCKKMRPFKMGKDFIYSRRRWTLQHVVQFHACYFMYRLTVLLAMGFVLGFANKNGYDT
jgi:hypothetical protein